MTIVQQLRRLIDEVRSTRGFERITVVTPTTQASFYLRRRLAKKGLFNVDFKRLEDISEQLAGREFNRPLLNDLQASEFVYGAARDQKPGTKLGGTDVSPQLQTALHSTFRQLELLPRDKLDALAAIGVVQRELVDRFDSYMQFASSHRHGTKVAERAAEIISRQNPSEPEPRVGALGVVLLVKAAPAAPVQQLLFDLLAELTDSVTVQASEETFLANPNKGQKTSQQPNQHLLPIGVPDVAEEVRSVVREIVALARQRDDGNAKKFSRLAVVFEDDSYASRIGEALELAGIPVSGPDRTALSDAPEGQFVTGLLDIFENDFSRLDLTAWLATAPVKNPDASPSTPAASSAPTVSSVPAARWDALSRTAGVTSSVQDSWIPRLDQYAAHRIVRAQRSERLDESGANEFESARSDAEYALALRDFVVTLAGRKPTAEQGSWSGFGKWLRSMADDYLLTTKSAAAESRRTRLFSLITRLESLETPGNIPGFKHCAGVLREQLGRRSAALRSLGSGVYVGPAWTAAGCPFDAVFVVGMTEGRYPTAGISDPLLPDPLKREIDGEGKYLKTVDRSILESQQSFESVISNAGKVVMYWPRGVPGEPRELGPARWFLEAARAVSGQPLLQAGQLVNPGRSTGPVEGVQIHDRTGPLAISATEAGDQHEFDVLAARSWNRGDNEPATFPLSGNVSPIADAVNFEHSQNRAMWSEYDGKIDLGGADSDLGETVGSATAFETYAACPYRYFLSRRLHIEPTESPEQELALDALTFGTLIHDVLEKFALWRMEFEDNPPGKLTQEKWLRSAVARHIQALKEETPGRSGGVWRIEQSRAWLILRRWLRREPTVAAQPDMRQVETEYSFGSDRGGPAVEVRTVSGKTVKFRGQVDRVDISDDGSRVIVYDYKSGGNSAYSKLKDDPIKKGTKLQLPLYSMAVADKYPDADISAAYWFVRESGSNELQPSPGNYLNDRAESAMKAAVETIVEGIDNGVFPAHPGDPSSSGDGPPSYENCKFCEYDRVCPKSRSRLWDVKKGSDPSLDNYRKLAEDDQ
jgi:ATP-dependent helicase/nuclease subunit B